MSLFQTSIIERITNTSFPGQKQPLKHCALHINQEKLEDNSLNQAGTTYMAASVQGQVMDSIYIRIINISLWAEELEPFLYYTVL